jgi:glycosyltransferase involved in cell wall biosynthesis
MYSLIIPVYNNEESLPKLLATVDGLNAELNRQLEAVFVIDGSPDYCYSVLQKSLPKYAFRSQLILLSRNFGSFTAIRMGLEHAQGPYFAVMAADLQEPPELIVDFFRTLEQQEYDVTIGIREERNDSVINQLSSNVFWSLFRKFVQTEMPRGGVDIFGCNLAVRNQLLALKESNTSLVGLLFWLGYRRKDFSYTRLDRQHGSSGWSFSKKCNYLVDSILAFSDLPIWMLFIAGSLGLGALALLGTAVLISYFMTGVTAPGYFTTILMILGFGTLNLFGLGVLGAYVWRIFENTKGRPHGVVLSATQFEVSE